MDTTNMGKFALGMLVLGTSMAGAIETNNRWFLIPMFVSFVYLVSIAEDF